MNWEVIDVTGLYRSGWQNEITPESFSHPAKFARGLIRYIYEFLFARGLLMEGQVVVDPFGGVGLGGLDAMQHGLHWIGVELEQKFVNLAGGYECDGIYESEEVRSWEGVDWDFIGGGWYVRYRLEAAYWGVSKERRYGWPEGYGFETQAEAQGFADSIADEYELLTVDLWETNEWPDEPPVVVLDVRVPACGRKENHAPHHVEGNIEMWNRKYAGRFRTWGTARIIQGDSRHLAQVLAEADCAITSPPFESIVQHDGGPALQQGGELHSDYGSTPGNLGNLAVRAGDLDAALTSPPFSPQGNQPTGRGQGVRSDYAEGKRKELAPDSDYGDSPGQIQSMPEGNIESVITSPPFLQTSGGVNVTSESGPLADASLIARHAAGNAAAEAFGESESNLGNMVEGGLDGAISSPPFADTGAILNVEGHARQVTAERAERLADKVYGIHPAQLGNLREGSVDSVLSSPPYANSLDSDKGGIDFTKSSRESDRHRDPTLPGVSGNRAEKYGESPVQLAALPEGAVEAALTSPPFESVTSDKPSKSIMASGLKMGASSTGDGYGETDGNLGNSEGDTFWSASRQILAQTYALLRPHVEGQPGGIAVFVTKDYVRAGMRVPFSDNWRRLAESVGFMTLYEIRAWVTEDNGTQLAIDGNHKSLKKSRKSFFRRLAERKGSPEINFETVWIMAKPFPGGDGGAHV